MRRNVDVLLLRLDLGLPVPTCEHPGDAGFDVYARGDHVVKPGHRALIPTGVAIALPEGFVALLHPRSGLALRNGFTLLNAPGTIDAGYRGEISVIGLNTGDTDFSISRGDRIAQLVFLELPVTLLHEVNQLPESIRSVGGFGSTGGHGSV